MENEKRTKIFSSKLQLGLPYINWFTSKSSLRCEIIFFIIFSTVSERICWNFSKKKNGNTGKSESSIQLLDYRNIMDLNSSENYV